MQTTTTPTHTTAKQIEIVEINGHTFKRINGKTLIQGKEEVLKMFDFTYSLIKRLLDAGEINEYHENGKIKTVSGRGISRYVALEELCDADLNKLYSQPIQPVCNKRPRIGAVEVKIRKKSGKTIKV